MAVQNSKIPEARWTRKREGEGRLSKAKPAKQAQGFQFKDWVKMHVVGSKKTFRERNKS